MKLAMRKWDPFKELNEFQNRLHGLFPVRGNSLAEDTGSTAIDRWEPAVDISEEEKQYTITADLPDVKKDEVDVTVSDGILTITGERAQEEETEGKKFHRVERSYGRYTRSFSLPEDADEEKLDATFKNGVLHVNIPKEPSKQKPEQRKIAVH